MDECGGSCQLASEQVSLDWVSSQGQETRGLSPSHSLPLTHTHTYAHTHTMVGSVLAFSQPFSALFYVRIQCSANQCRLYNTSSASYLSDFIERRPVRDSKPFSVALCLCLGKWKTKVVHKRPENEQKRRRYHTDMIYQKSDPLIFSNYELMRKYARELVNVDVCCCDFY